MMRDACIGGSVSQAAGTGTRRYRCSASILREEMFPRQIKIRTRPLREPNRSGIGRRGGTSSADQIRRGRNRPGNVRQGPRKGATATAAKPASRVAGRPPVSCGPGWLRSCPDALWLAVARRGIRSVRRKFVRADTAARAAAKRTRTRRHFNSTGGSCSRNELRCGVSLNDARWNELRCY